MPSATVRLCLAPGQRASKAQKRDTSGGFHLHGHHCIKSREGERGKMKQCTKTQCFLAIAIGNFFLTTKKDPQIWLPPLILAVDRRSNQKNNNFTFPGFPQTYMQDGLKTCKKHEKTHYSIATRIPPGRFRCLVALTLFCSETRFSLV